MPLFTFKCDQCSKIDERLTDADSTETCECGSPMNKVFKATVGGRIWKGSRDNLENVIKPEVDKINESLSKNNDSTFFDVCGDE